MHLYFIFIFPFIFYFRINPDVETDMIGSDATCTPINRQSVKSRLNSDVLESRKRKNHLLDTSQQRCSKRQKMYSSSTESLNEEELSDARKSTRFFSTNKPVLIIV